MKLDGKETIAPHTQVVRIEREDWSIDLTISAIPFAFSDFIESKEIVRPLPPNTRLKIDGGFVKNKSGFATEIDLRDPEYLAQSRLYDRRLTALIFAEHLRHEPKFDPGVERPARDAKPGIWQTYADALAVGLEKLNLTDEEVARVIEVGHDMVLGDIDTDEDNDFLSKEEAERNSREASSTTN